jgi:3-phenylpropionate/cinnamic acid dioxygenase small subunit
MPTPSVEDRNAINDLFVRYMWALDAGDVEGVIGCFARDGSLESPSVGRYSGQAGLREFATRFAGFKERGTALRHFITNMIIDVTGDTGRAQCYLAVFLVKGGASRLLAPGRYDCTLVREDGQWRFQNRLVVMDHDYELEGI